MSDAGSRPPVGAEVNGTCRSHRKYQIFHFGNGAVGSGHQLMDGPRQAGTAGGLSRIIPVWVGVGGAGGATPGPLSLIRNQRRRLQETGGRREHEEAEPRLLDHQSTSPGTADAARPSVPP